MPVKNIWLHVNFAKTTGKDGKFRFAKYWLIDLLIDWLVDCDKIDKMTAITFFLNYNSTGDALIVVDVSSENIFSKFNLLNTLYILTFYNIENDRKEFYFTLVWL